MNLLEQRGKLIGTNNKYNLIDADKLAELIISCKGNQTAKIIEVEGRRCILYMNSTTNNKDLTACCPAFKEKTRYVFSFEARPHVLIDETEPYTYSLWMGFKPSGVNAQTGLNGKKTKEFTRTTCISYAGKTVTDIDLTWGAMRYWLIDLDSVRLYEYDKFLKLGGHAIWG